MSDHAAFRSRGFSRRSVLGAIPAAAALAAGLGRPRRASAAGQLNIYSWPDYFSTDDLAAYAKKSGVTPNIATYDSNDTMFAKLNSPAGAGFDIVIPSSEWIKQLSEKGLLQEIDHSKLNLAALDQNLLNRDYDPGNKYSIPKDWGLLGVVYDPEAVGGEIATWEDFFKAGEKPGVSGKIRLSSSGWETIGPALWLDGKDWNKATEADIRAAGERLKTFAKHVKSFSGLDANSVANGSIVLAQTNQGKARAIIGLNRGSNGRCRDRGASSGSTIMRSSRARLISTRPTTSSITSSSPRCSSPRPSISASRRRSQD